VVQMLAISDEALAEALIADRVERAG